MKQIHYFGEMILNEGRPLRATNRIGALGTLRRIWACRHSNSNVFPLYVARVLLPGINMNTFVPY